MRAIDRLGLKCRGGGGVPDNGAFVLCTIQEKSCYPEAPQNGTPNNVDMLPLVGLFIQSFVCLSGSDNCIAVSELSATSGDIAPGLTRMLSGRGGPSFTAHINRGK